MQLVAPSHSSNLVRKILASGAIGNILETYDLILITLMATTISQVFYPPSSNPYAYIINILYIYLISLLIRPIGNIIMGIFADQVGRKKIMVISLVCTGLGTTFTGLIPTYDQIGAWSTAFFIASRIFTNFFAGIEYVNSATYLLENSSSKNQGFYSSWAAIGISGGYLLASLIALLTTYLIDHHFIPAWCWRFVFLFSVIGIAFGFWVRNSVPESFIYIMNNNKTIPTTKLQLFKKSIAYINEHKTRCISIAAITFLGVYLSYIYYIYIPLQLITTRGFSPTMAFGINAISLCLVVILIPVFGKLTDHYDKYTFLKAVCISIAILALPFFWYASFGNFNQILILSLIISIPASCFFSLYPQLITQSFPSKIRCTTASLIYQIIVSLEMGTLPLLVNFTIRETQIPYASGYFLIFAAVIGFFGLLSLNQENI